MALVRLGGLNNYIIFFHYIPSFFNCQQDYEFWNNFYAIFMAIYLQPFLYAANTAASRSITDLFFKDFIYNFILSLTKKYC